ncbi:MAG: 30S ribosomal protein S2 [Candidatus Goldbacteria bacterium]|nr:30S ribosomal protein S2 [Candidatus Goldiibacteriota bacterium]
MPQISMKALLEAGVHFGHQTKRWNPKMKPYIYTARNGIYIIDLQKTLKYTRDAVVFVKSIIREGKKIIFVGTKKQASDAIKEEAIRCGMPYVASRWLGGTLTNFVTIKQRIERLKYLDEQAATGGLDKYPIKEKMNMQKELKKLKENLEGLKDIEELPGALFVIDVKHEENAVKEANKLGIPVIGVVDTNCDPDGIDVIIPGNDDAIRAVRLMCKIIADSIIEEKIAMEKEKEVIIGQESTTPESIITEKQEEIIGEKEKIESLQDIDTSEYEKMFLDDIEIKERKKLKMTKKIIDETLNK